MYRELIGERNDSQITTAEFRNRCPKPESVVFLRLDADRRLDNANAHVFRKIRALPQNLVLKIRRELVGGHVIDRRYWVGQSFQEVRQPK